MDASEFCSIENNQDSFYCYSYEIIGNLPQQYDFVYGISAILIFCIFLVVIYSIAFVFKAIRG